jgi:ABC-type lipoprotein release transport system permease subunit
MAHRPRAGVEYDARRMDWPYELQIGWRYTRAGRSGRRNRFISFISAASMAGIALGVAALIIVLSVMNGFRKEVRDRMLSVVSHVEVGISGGESLADWRAMAERVRRHPEVEAIAPFVAAEVLIARGDDMRGVVVRGRRAATSCSASSWPRRSGSRKATGSASSCPGAPPPPPAWCRGWPR